MKKVKNNGKYIAEHFIIKEGKMLCAECREWLPTYMFSKRNSTKRGYNMCCKRCYGKHNCSYDLTNEWRDVIGYEGIYKVSIDGEIISLERSFIVNGNNVYLPTKKLSQRQNHNGYMTAILSNNGRNKTILVHRIVASAFIDNPNNFDCINHKDENKHNNNADNLEWCNHLYNNNYGTRNEKISNSHTGAIRTELQKINMTKSQRNNGTPVAQIDIDGNVVNVFISISEATERTGIKHIAAAMFRNGKAGGYNWIKISKDCYKAIAAINDENDRYHYYTCVRSYIDGCDCITANKGDIKFGDWETCTSNMSKNWVKSTPSELIDHFKKQMI